LALGLVGFSVFAEAQSGFVASDVGLGLNTSSVIESYEGRPLNRRLDRVVEMTAQTETLQAKGRPVALWLGASQLHAINQLEPSQHLASWHASEAARGRGHALAYVQMSAPNANYNELLALYLAFRQREALPQAVVLGFTYDDLAEPGVRWEVSQHLRPLGVTMKARLGAVADSLASSPEASGAQESATSPTESTPQDRLEGWLVTSLVRLWPAYSQRSALQATLITAWKIPLTKLVFSMTQRPKRLVPAHLKTWNGKALDALLELIRDDGVELFVYQAPIRPDPSFFLHDRSAYDAYHVELRTRVEDLGGHWLNLETLVPTEYWGVGIVGLPDLFHFREEGHRRLGMSIDSWLAQSPALAGSISDEDPGDAVQ
jgi:hypothetical protein